MEGKREHILVVSSFIRWVTFALILKNEPDIKVFQTEVIA